MDEVLQNVLREYIHSFPGCLKMCNAMEEFCEITSQTTQNYSNNSRTLIFVTLVAPWTDHNLRYLSSGISSDSKVNCDNAQAIGETALQAIVGKTFVEAKICRKAKINSLSVMYNTVTINDKVVPVSENQLFMQIVCIMKSGTEKAEYFKYELSPQLPALFDGPHMRKTDKSAFTTLFKNVSPEENIAVGSPTFVIDGGYLLHACCNYNMATAG
ncbi:hypothetical protein PR048_001629 [Dryococelus australis]|uniref:Uncharacterized protein n=1 Tax=Dryococelus australis TaxID=614101 RepID=A0ABQ9IHW4_9NEOP|nr:hypothetical protein PR048_001629 [Dryococelus australis]